MNLTIRTLALTMFLSLCACSDNTPPSSEAVLSDVSADSATATNETANAAPVWYHRARLLDVTGDGILDSLDLKATGRTSDSSALSFQVIVDGTVAYTHSWSSEYELVDAPPEAATPAGRDSLLRASLDTTLARIAVRAINASKWTGNWTGRGNDCMNDPRDCAAQEFRRRGANIDSAAQQLANDMRRPGALQFSLSYGFETTLQLAWSPSAREVFVIFACC